MEFSVNHPIIFVIVAVIILVVLGQSIFFLVRAIKRSKEIGMDKAVIKKTIVGAALFTIAPAVAILVGVLVLAKSLGVAVPWLRLSVIGSLSYEQIAAANAMNSFDPIITVESTITANQFVTIIFVMTSGIMIGLLLVPLLTKKISGGIKSLEKRDKKWMEIFNTAMFLGMISAFLGYVFCNLYMLWNEGARNYTDASGNPATYSATHGVTPILVMLVSAVVMAGLGILSKKTKKRWITDYALPISLVAGMLAAIPFTIWLG